MFSLISSCCQTLAVPIWREGDPHRAWDTQDEHLLTAEFVEMAREKLEPVFAGDEGGIRRGLVQVL